jgi:hypothetical protein
MGMVIWYKLEFPAAGLLGGTVRVSNDVLSGDYVTDAEITVEMTAGDVADHLRATITNLPADVADGIKSQHDKPADKSKPLTVKAFLGYFDEPDLGTSPVMEAVVTSVTVQVGGDGSLVTEVEGQEIGGYRLRKASLSLHQKGVARLDQVVRTIAQKVGVDVAKQASGLGTVKDYTLTAKTGLQALNEIARNQQVPLIITDKTVYIGAAVGAGGLTASFRQGKNIVSLTRVQGTEDRVDPSQEPGSTTPSATNTTLQLKALGNPSYRVGQAASVETSDPRDIVVGPRRINHVLHQFSTRSGYTCDVTVIAAKPGALGPPSRGVDGLTNRLVDIAETVAGVRPAVDVGEVSDYEPGSKDHKHLATLKYAQSPAANVVAPSVETTVNDQPLLHDKPIVSPFAWYNTGLVVPVYEGMRAVLLHNRGLVNDTLVGGFVWADNPKQDPPENQRGDYWLCLPTNVLAQATRPSGKTVNDLIDGQGMRVIACKGFRIFVGDANLNNVGERPDVPSNQTLVIEHEKGAKISIGIDGAISISTNNKDITIGNGQVTLKLTGASVEVK